MYGGQGKGRGDLPWPPALPLGVPRSPSPHSSLSPDAVRCCWCCRPPGQAGGRASLVLRRTFPASSVLRERALDGFYLKIAVILGMTGFAQASLVRDSFRVSVQIPGWEEGNGFSCIIPNFPRLLFGHHCGLRQTRGRREEGRGRSRPPEGRGARASGFSQLPAPSPSSPVASSSSPIAGARSGGEHPRHGFRPLPLPLPLPGPRGQSRAHASVTGSLPYCPLTCSGGLANSSLHCFLQRLTHKL